MYTATGGICMWGDVLYSTYASSAFTRYSTSGSCGTGNHRSRGLSYHYLPSTGNYFAGATPYSPYQAW